MAFCINVLNFFLDKVKFYDGRQTSWCAGNDALAEVGLNITLHDKCVDCFRNPFKPFLVLGPGSSLLFFVQYSSIWNYKIWKN